MIENSPLRTRVLSVVAFAGGQALDLKDYKIYLNSVELSPSREPNKASLTIYNLGARNRELLSAEHQGLEIVAGYDPTPGLIFRGETYTVTHAPPEKNTPEWITTIEAADSGQAFNESWASSSWPSGTPVAAVLTGLGQTMGLVVKTDVRGRLESPWCCNSRTADALSTFCEDRDLSWQIYQGIIEVLPEGGTADRSAVTVVQVSKDTGMIGAPKLVEREPKGGQKRFGVACKNRMHAPIRPRGLVEIVSSAPTAALVRTRKQVYRTPGVNGVYRVGRVVHYGSLITPDFVTEFETESFYANR